MAVGSNNSRLNKGPCFWCIKAVKWIPVLFIVTVVLWSYYAYVVQLCICKYILFMIIVNKRNMFLFLTVTIDSTVKKIIYLILYHILFGMFTWAYWQTIFTEIGRVPYKVSMTFEAC